MNQMNIYLSKSSREVKIITTALFITITIVVIALFSVNGKYGNIAAGILSLILIGTFIYFYAISLDRIIVDDKMVTLKRNLGEIKIPLSEVQDIKNLEFSNLTMTYGSKGVFGYIGNTMDDCTSMVKDRRNMIRIDTKDKKYIVNSERPTELIKEIKNTLHNSA